MCNGLQSLKVLLMLLLCGCAEQENVRQAAQTRLQLGLIYLSRGELDAAQRNLRRAAQVMPEDYRTQLALARLSEAQGKTVLAQNHYQSALKLAPHNDYVLNNYGAFLCGLGQYDKAHQQFTLAAQAATPESEADSLENAGYCWLKAGNWQAARQALTQALQADRSKGEPLLTEAGKRLTEQDYAGSRTLLAAYQYGAPVTAASLWLEIRFAALERRSADIHRYGQQLARNFPQSIQYQQYLANEY